MQRAGAGAGDLPFGHAGQQNGVPEELFSTGGEVIVDPERNGRGGLDVEILLRAQRRDKHALSRGGCARGMCAQHCEQSGFQGGQACSPELRELPVIAQLSDNIYHADIIHECVTEGKGRTGWTPCG